MYLAWLGTENVLVPEGRISVSDLLSDAYYQQLSPSVVQNPDYIPEEYRIDCSIDAGMLDFWHDKCGA